VTQNPWSWGNVSNNLFIEAPSGVGFSYCESETGCQHTDTSTAQDNLQSILSFFAAYPELKANDYWIAGESYAGIYVPSLAYAIYQHNLGATPDTFINLKGILVGNGCLGNVAGHCGNDPTGLNDYHDIQIWRGHGLVSETNYDAIMAACEWANESNECNNLLQDAADSIGNIDVYFLYNTCPDPALTRGAGRARAPFGARSMLARINKARAARGELAVGVDPLCFESTATLERWANQPAVKAALHVAPTIDWAVCSNNNSFSYNSDIADERTLIYPTLTKVAGYKVLVYNGEADLCGAEERAPPARPPTRHCVPDNPLHRNPTAHTPIPNPKSPTLTTRRGRAA
jgi:serine carboxypeptidase-like clade 2